MAELESAYIVICTGLSVDAIRVKRNGSVLIVGRLAHNSTCLVQQFKRKLSCGKVPAIKRLPCREGKITVSFITVRKPDRNHRDLNASYGHRGFQDFPLFIVVSPHTVQGAVTVICDFHLRCINCMVICITAVFCIFFYDLVPVDTKVIQCIPERPE